MTIRDELKSDIEVIRRRFFQEPRSFRPEVVLARRLDDAILEGWDGQGLQTGCAVFAVGGYGRRALHPYSDLDLLVFFAGQADPAVVERLLKPLWDLPFRVGHQLRQATDFESFELGQMESYTAFMDSRFLWGDADQAERFMGTLLPRFVQRWKDRILSRLIDMKAERWSRYDDTVFQLEPDLKTAPGGLRDYHWTRWVARVIGTDADLGLASATEFLHRIRNYLHFLEGRDQNTLTYEYQERIASELGYADSDRGEAAEVMMREYFLKAESIADRVASIEEEILGRPDRFLLPGPLNDARSMLRAFADAHRDKSGLDGPALDRIRVFVSQCRSGELATGENGRAVLDMMKDSIGIYDTLRAMHRVGLLGAVFPEFEEIRCRVIRDFFHKYTVDQHSLIAICNIERLGADGDGMGVHRGLQVVLRELTQPELLLLAILLHDTGKAAHHPTGDHACTSVEVIEGVLDRLELSPEEQNRVRLAVQNHLEMSKVIMRRDISDPEVVRQFSEIVGTQDDLRMLCLLTFADMKAVSPEVWTSWKGDLLFQLYLETFSFLRRHFPDDRYTGDEVSEQQQAHVLRHLSQDVAPSVVREFLDGLPTQFLRSVSQQRLAGYMDAYLQYSNRRPVVIDLFQNKDCWEVLVITSDSPLLFSRMTGALAAFGMNTVRAHALSNRRGVVLDLIAFEDPGRRLEMNPWEVEQLRQLLADSVLGRVPLEGLLGRRTPSVIRRLNEPPIPLSVCFDASSPERTIMEIVAGDDIGLLFNVTRIIGSLDCDIEVALISTEGRRAFDVFYLKRAGHPLTDAIQSELEKKLVEALLPAPGGGSSPA